MPDLISRPDGSGAAPATHDHILLIRLKSMGDIVHTLPAVHAVRENFPDARISFLASKEFAPLLEGFCDVNRIIPLDRALYRRGNPVTILIETVSLLRRLRRERCSLVVDFQSYGETALLTWWTRARERWCNAYRRKWRWTYTRHFGGHGGLHFAERHLSLLRRCGLRIGAVRNEFVLPDRALAGAREFYQAQRLETSRPALFIQPLTSRRHKDWPLENYLALARYWRDRGLPVLFGGGPADHAALEPVRQSGFTVSAGVPLLTTAGLMKLSALVVGGDTGVLHLAVAMKQRVVMLMASAAPGKPHPFQHPDWAVTPADQQNVSCIETGAVIEVCARAFAESGLTVPSQ